MSANDKMNTLIKTHYPSVCGIESRDFQYQPTIIAFSFEGVLIQSKSGRSVPKSTTDIELFDSSIVRMLKTEVSRNNAIVILQNSQYKADCAKVMIEAAVSTFYNLVKVPILCMFAEQKNSFWKPHTKLWSMLKALYEHKGKKITSIKYVGCHAACVGAPKLDLMKVDDSDQAFINNVGTDSYFSNGSQCLGFQHIDEYLQLTSKPYKLTWNTRLPDMEIRKSLLEALSIKHSKQSFDIMSELNKLPKSDSYIIMSVGPPCAEKSRFCKGLHTFLEKNEWSVNNKCVQVTDGTYRTYLQAQKSIAKYMEQQITVIMDIPLYTEAQRKPYIEMASTRKVSILCICHAVDVDLAHLLCKVRTEQIDTWKYVEYPDSVFDAFKMHYQKPVASPNMAVINYYPKIKITAAMYYRY